jgi:hypothetical protein
MTCRTCTESESEPLLRADLQPGISSFEDMCQPA